MPPKGKKGKGKKGDDDDDAYWEAKAAKAPTPAATKPVDDDSEDEPAPKKFNGAQSAFAALGAEGGDEDEDGGGGGGLMGAIKKSKDKKKKKGGKAQQDDEDEDFGAAPPAPEEPSFQVAGDDEWPEDEVKPKKGKKAKSKHTKTATPAAADEEPIEDSVAKLAISDEPVIQIVGDDEWPEEDVKPKKGKGEKKGGKKSKAQVGEDEDEFGNPIVPAATTSAPAAAAADTPAAEEVGADSDAEEGGETKVLTKKEKEQRKKEKEKAKKKAQQAAKKAATATTEDSPADATPPPPSTADTAAAAGDDDDGEDDGSPASGDKKKNKKKKKKAAAEPAAPAPAKAPTGKLAVLRAALEAKKAADEAAARKAEEQRRLIEEEEARVAEEERIAEEAKQKKKEKEKAKRDLAKKEGRLLTPKQRQEKAAAEARLQSLLASGVTIEGLKKDDDGAEDKKPKRVVYGNKKKKGPQQPKVDEPTPVEKVEEVKPAKEEDGEDDWEKSDEEVVPVIGEKEVKEDDGDDWDASSVEGEVAASPPPPPAPSASKPTPVSEATPSTKSNGKAPVVEESSEDDDDEDDDESDDDSDDSSDDGSSDDDSSDEEELSPAQKKQAAAAAEAARLAEEKKTEAKRLRVERHKEAMAARSADDLRSPICCILGHVDTGKTKLLDKIRQTNVQEGEAGGITQQIGATYFPVEAIKQKTAVINKDGTYVYKIPGLLVIDTPGHESFSNLRTRGSSLCNIAILVVDIMHGLEPQTLESLKLLRDKKTPFVVALNKIDRIYGWDATPNGAFQESLARQTLSVQREFADRVQKTQVAFAEQGLNSELYWKNKNLGKNVSLVPTSAITGEGIPDMIQLLVDLTQQRMTESLMYISELECTVLEVKVIEGLGTTIDVVLSNGYLREGDRIVVCGLNGPIFTNVRALLTPQPLREMRVKSQYVHHQQVKAALGIKISAPDLEKAIAGSRLLVVGPDDDEETLGEEVMADLQNLLSWVDKSGRGVSVQASTLGSLEALLDFLKTSKIPVSTINIGPVHKRDVIQASTMLEKAKELACMLCFDVPVDKEAEKLADELGVRLFKADIIYHLFDKFTAYNKEVQDAKKVQAAGDAYWPCRLKIIQTFARRDPIVIGVDILDGTLRVGTPLCVVHTETDNSTKPPTVTKSIIDIGRITSIEKNHEVYQKLTKKNIGAGAAIKVEAIINQPKLQVGRHFEETDELYSHITRNSIDVMKEHFRAEAEPSDWALIKKLKPLLDIA